MPQNNHNSDPKIRSARGDMYANQVSPSHYCHTHTHLPQLLCTPSTSIAAIIVSKRMWHTGSPITGSQSPLTQDQHVNVN
jgi:hypothetical protein